LEAASKSTKVWTLRIARVNSGYRDTETQ
jgi:hypothetical protein